MLAVYFVSKSVFIVNKIARLWIAVLKIVGVLSIILKQRERESVAVLFWIQFFIHSPSIHFVPILSVGGCMHACVYFRLCIYFGIEMIRSWGECPVLQRQ